MTNLPVSLPEELRRAGLKVVVLDGWVSRGRPGAFDPVGVLNHHTGASARGWSLAKELSYAKWMFLTGRPDLPAPLCQIALGRSGTVYIGAAGRANHGGSARPSGSVSGGDANTLYVGIEWMLSGTEAIPAEMMEAGVTLNAVLLEKVTQTSERAVSCHYNTSVTGKWDIGDPNGIMHNGSRVLDIEKFRRSVAVERERLYTRKPSHKRLRVGMINIPGKIGPRAIRRCFDAVASRSVVWGVNESFHPEQRLIYIEAMADSERDINSYGLRITPNPVFWYADRFERVSARVHRLHPKNTTAPNADEWPGFYDARYVTEVVLRQRADGKEVAVLNTHLAAEVKVVDQRWLRKVKEASKECLRELVREHEKAGRVVVVMGDMNTKEDFAMPRGFRWLVKGLIDKIGSNRRGSGGIFDAPTDHGHGVRATIRL